jgi:hypothetical protein
LLSAALLVAAACQRDKETPGPTTSGQQPAADLLGALESDASVEALLALLARPHRDARNAIGPHRLSYTANFELKPVDDPGRPKVGQPVLTDQAVTDELILEWGSAPGEPTAFRLEQHNDHDEGREIIVIDETVFSQLRHRSWFERGLDSELHELWLDDAFHSVHDAVAFAAPNLAVEVSDDGETVSVALNRSEAKNADLVRVDPSTDWRHRAEIESIEGTVVIDKASGVWRSGTVSVGYSLADKLGRKLRGRTAVEGSLEPADPGSITIKAPQGASPLPERERLELERAKLLDGLAAP